MYLDITKPHTKRIKAVNDTEKQFNSKRGVCRKYKVIFDDGYEAEYCPPIGQFDDRMKGGNTIAFKIIHQGGHGDEIEPYFVPGGEPTSPDQPGILLRPATPINIASHPATIALNASIRFHGEVKKDGAGLDEILSRADEVYEWLINKTQISS